MVCFIVVCILTLQNSLDDIVQFPVSNIFAQKGYGDYNGKALFHQALDFPAEEFEYVLVPHAGYTNTVIFSQISDPTDVIIGLSTAPATAEAGWVYEHLDFSDPLTPNPPSIGDHFTIDITWCCYHDLGRHVHMGWFTIDDFNNQNQPGYFNPFDSLSVPGGYDEVSFKHVHLAGTSPEGIWFNNLENDGLFPPLSNLQDILYGVVDAVICPCSEYPDPGCDSSSGVRSISYRLLGQHPHYLTYDKEYSKFTWRMLFDMDGYLPYQTTIARAKYGKVYGFADHTHNNIIITNSGSANSVNNPLDNIWILDYDRVSDWSDGQFCRGAWDTWLGNSIDNTEATVIEHAEFPDGRYAFEVTAVSSSGQDEETLLLPVEDVQVPGSPVVGVVVDNYQPFVKQVSVSYFLDDSPLSDEQVYFGHWDISDTVSGLYRELDPYPVSYLPVTGTGTIYIIVTFSEPEITVDPDCSVRLSASWCKHDNSNYHYHSPWFTPVTDRSETPLTCNADSDRSGNDWVVHYELNNFNFEEEGYLGWVTVSIGNPYGLDNSTSSFQDLAGNYIDTNPGTIAERRDENGVFSGVGYEHDSSVDMNHTFGNSLHWWLESGSNVFYVGASDLGVVRKHEYPRFSDNECLIDDCSEYCGYWLGYSDESLYSFNISVIQGDQEATCVINTGFDVPFPLGWGNFREFPERVSGISDIRTSLNNKICWVFWGYTDGCAAPDLHPYYCRHVSPVNYFAVNAETGGIASGCIFTGYVAFYPGYSDISESFTNLHQIESVCKHCNSLETTFSDDRREMYVCPMFSVLEEYEDGSLLVQVEQGHVDGTSSIFEFTLNPPSSDSCFETSPCSNRVINLDNYPSTFNIIANPCIDNILIDVYCQAGNEYSILIHDITGRLITRINEVAEADCSVCSIPVSDLPSGVYFVTVNTEGNYQTKRITIIR